MSDASTSPATSPRGTAGLWWLCVIVIAGVFAAWSATRWKPVGWFPAAYGGLFGAIAALLRSWIGLPTQPTRTVTLALLAAVGASVALLLAAQIHMRREAPLTGIAARMMEEHRRLAFDDEPTPEASKAEAWVAGLRDYLMTRYGRRPDGLLAVGLLLESAIAAGACWAVMRWMPHPTETAP